MTDTVKKYVKIKEQIKKLEDQKEELETSIMDEIDSSGGHPIVGPFGSIQLMSRTTYEYSDNVKAMEERVKDIKRKEEATGQAFIKTSSRYLRLVKDKFI